MLFESEKSLVEENKKLKEEYEKLKFFVNDKKLIKISIGRK